MNVNLIIPTTLNEITLGQYQEYAKLQDLSETDLQLKTIEIFCNVPEVVVRNMKATDILEICGIINNMFDTKHQLISMFKMNGVEYGFIPSLEDMSFGEYVPSIIINHSITRNPSIITNPSITRNTSIIINPTISLL